MTAIPARSLPLALLSLVALSTLPAAEVQVFSPAAALDEVPAGRLRDKLAVLDAGAQTRALRALAGVPRVDAASLNANADGHLYYTCTAHDHAHEDSVALRAPTVSRASVSVNSPPVRHSKRGASAVIYLDFNGGLVTGRAWNEEEEYGPTASWNCRPYSTDTDFTTFSDEEQAAIITIWERVAEDFAPFDIDVTTDAPSRFTVKTAWAMITPTIDANGEDLPHKGYGGIAYVDVFGKPDFADFSPAWVTGTMAPIHIADAVSHEIGHNLGLNHDGGTSGEYEDGFAATATAPSWGPIMGAPYNMQLSQWSKGQYAAATNGQDDLAIIAAKTAYREDDHDGTIDDADSMTTTNGSIAGSGIIEKTSEIDMFRLSMGSGNISIVAAAFTGEKVAGGGNLDIQLALLDSDGAVVASSRTVPDTGTILTGTVTSGTYYLAVSPDFAGTPNASSGYVVYGSLGQYTITGTVPGGGGGNGPGGDIGGDGVNPVDPDTGGNTGSGRSPDWSSAQGDDSSGCGLGGGSTALICGGLLFLLRGRKRR